jgi:plastocyanin
MTDETTDAPAGEEAQADDAPAAETAVATIPVPAAEAAVTPAAAPEPVPFWRRPNFERFVAPLVIPIVAVLGVVIMVLNISRLLLSAHGHIPVVVGSIITGGILFGAAALSNSARMRSTSMNLLTIGFVLLIISGGWLVLGHSQVKSSGGAPLANSGPCSGSITITALPSIKFTPSSVSVKTGIYCITLTGAQPHTLNFDNETALLYPGVELNSPATKVSARIFFGTAGAYTYYCAIPGHRAAGMFGTVNVTGPTMTVAQAEAAGGSGGATGASGASGASGATGATGSTGASGSTG